jgi:hypothetical protein
MHSHSSGARVVRASSDVAEGVRHASLVSSRVAPAGEAGRVSPRICITESRRMVSGIGRLQDVSCVVVLVSRGQPNCIGIPPAFGSGQIAPGCITCAKRRVVLHSAAGGQASRATVILDLRLSPQIASAIVNDFASLPIENVDAR